MDYKTFLSLKTFTNKMILKTTSVLLILLANFILLVHDVVPHHHHKGLVTFNHSNIDDDYKHEEEHNKEHKHNSDNHTCILKQSVIVPANSIRYSCTFLDQNHLDPYSILFNSRAENSEFLPFTILPFRLIIKSKHPDIVNKSLGLRAPPIA